MLLRRALPTLLLLLPAIVWPQTAEPNRDPDKARLVTSDIPNFWRVFDSASVKDAADRFQRDYLDAGSPGLHDFTKSRIGNGRNLAVLAVTRTKYLAAIRESTLAIDQKPEIKAAIHASFRKLQDIYPAAVFPDVYFMIGRMNSAGTVGPSGLLIGVEMNARDAATPIDELGAWERAVIGQIANLPNIVAHELIHIEQRRENPLQLISKPTLLAQSLAEGGADFLGELISGGTINRVQRAYGDAHEAALWAEFSRDMQATDSSRWLFEGDKAKDRPADMGYYVGFKICEAYYKQTADKKEAVRRILGLKDPEALLKESGYGNGFQISSSLSTNPGSSGDADIRRTPVRR